MAASCPNKSHPDWVALVEEVGEDKAWEAYIDNDFNIPSSWRKTNEAGLNEAINNFLSSIGVTVKQVSEIINRDGEVIGANAMADMLYKTIQVVEGKATADTLPEEASHFLVSMLRGSTLYTSMYNDIHKYEVYKEVLRDYSTQYNNNEVKLKEEAMAKVIAMAVVDNFTDEKLESRTSSWWNRVIQYLRDVFSKGNKQQLEFDIQENAPFSEAADIITNGWINKEYYPFRENDGFGEEQFFQLDNQRQETVVKAIKDNLGKGSLSLEGERYVLTKPDGTKKEIKNRVSDRVARAMGKFGTRELSAQEQANIDVRSEKGTKGHADMENIINRAVALSNNTIVPSKTEALGKDMYRTLEGYMTKFMASFPKGTTFLAENKIYDEKADEGATVDLIAVMPDGTVDIYDWKFQEFKGKKDNKQIKAYKIKNWNIQLGRYAEMLNKVYGIEKSNIRKKRVIPIETEYDGNDLKSIKIGPSDIKAFTKKNAHLRPVPLVSELTGDERLDKLLLDLIQRREELEKLTAPVTSDDAKRAAFREVKNLRIKEINDAIQELQLTNDIGAYIKRGLRQLKDINTTGLTNLSEEQLGEAYKNVKFYGKGLIQTLGKLVEDKTKDYQSDLKDLVTNSLYLEGLILNEFIDRGKTRFGEDIDSRQVAGNWWTRNLRTLSQQNHPVLKSFYKLVQGSKKATRDALTDLNKKIEHSLEELRTYQESKGITGTNMFDFMLDKTGKRLRLAAKYSQEFYNERNRQRDILKNGTEDEKETALDWFRENTEFDTETYEKAYEEHKEQTKKFFKNYDKPTELIKRSLKDFENKNGDVASAYANNTNKFYTKPKNTHYSEGYKNIQSNDALKNFYNLFVESTQDYRKIVGQPYDARFIWNIKKDFVDTVAENGLFSTNPLTFIDDMVKLQAGIRDGNVDPQTGEVQHSIPKYYLEGVETPQQSTDLGRVLYMAGAMAHNYKNMAEIEDAAKGLEIILRNSEEVLTNNNGEEVESKITGKLQTIMGSSDTIDQFKDYMNYYIYGVKNKTKDYKISVLGKEISAIATYKFINKAFVGKTLALNPISIVANSVGGDWNARIVGAGKRFYSTSQYNSSLKDLGIRDAKATAIVGYLDLLDGENAFTKSNDLSVSNLTKHVTYEKMFIGQKLGDYAIRNGVGLAMMKSHTVQDGKIVKIKDVKKGETSLFDMLSVEESKLTGLDAIPAEELEKFRTRILKVTEDILGNNSRDDIRTAQLTIMGQALLTFRSWIPRTVDARYGELRFSEDINEYELGRYRSFWGMVVNKQFLPMATRLLADVVTFNSFNFSEGGIIGKAKEMYQQAIIDNPSLNMTEEEYIELHLANMRGNIAELYILGSMISLLFMAKPSPDDDKDGEFMAVRKYVSRQLDRNLSELLFYYNPKEFTKILKSPLPIIRVFSDLTNLFVDTGKEGYGALTGDDRMQYDARPMKYGLKIFPILNGIENTISLFDENYDRDETYNASGGKNR